MLRIKDIKEADTKSKFDTLEIKGRREAIIAKCFECSAYDMKEAKACVAFSCPLWTLCLNRVPKDLSGKSRYEIITEMKARQAKHEQEEIEDRTNERNERNETE